MFSLTSKPTITAEILFTLIHPWNNSYRSNKFVLQRLSQSPTFKYCMLLSAAALDTSLSSCKCCRSLFFQPPTPPLRSHPSGRSTLKLFLSCVKFEIRVHLFMPPPPFSINKYRYKQKQNQTKSGCCFVHVKCSRDRIEPQIITGQLHFQPHWINYTWHRPLQTMNFLFNVYLFISAEKKGLKQESFKALCSPPAP